MGVCTYETKIITTIPLAKMFTAFVLDGDNLIPKVVPQAVKSVEIIEGDGGPGSIKKITFGEVQSIITLVNANYFRYHLDSKTLSF
ncbi:hypothetical protein SLEP1_g17233 [Rubroshorea leprosula]|uniref:Bet v I/Major latex protein domain-containing protein n=1 Tax=Rubroshorea leprosula TaxID=152421 RepID=A0AAV5J5A2_9ROSI|nr:hypothetical protein SLEP1_g17233 [Rubroshorea leprosula]